MNREVYKSAQGRQLLESFYKHLLESHHEPLMTRLFAQTRVGPTHILRFGNPENPALVMIHGSMSNSATWLGDVHRFTPRFCVYCLDVPGDLGLSEAKRMILQSPEPLGWLEDVLTELNISQCSFLGMSLGSWFALNFAVNQPHRVTSLSMITTSGIAPQRIGFVFKALGLMLLGKPGMAQLNKLIYHGVQVPAELLEFQALAAKHFRPLSEPIPLFTDQELSRLTMPLQYFGGDSDVLLNSQATIARLNALVPHAETHLLPDTGHVIIDRFADAARFLVKSMN